jgi:hypothetical protein
MGSHAAIGRAFDAGETSRRHADDLGTFGQST